MTLATVARLGFHPCSAAWVQKVKKSGGSGQLIKKSQLFPPDPVLNVSIMVVKSVVPSVYAPPNTSVHAAPFWAPEMAPSVGGHAAAKALPSASLGNIAA